MSVTIIHDDNHHDPQRKDLQEVENLWGEIDIEGIDRVMERLIIEREKAEFADHSLKELEKGPQDKEPKESIFFDPKELDI